MCCLCFWGVVVVGGCCPKIAHDFLLTSKQPCNTPWAGFSGMAQLWKVLRNDLIPYRTKWFHSLLLLLLIIINNNNNIRKQPFAFACVCARAPACPVKYRKTKARLNRTEICFCFVCSSTYITAQLFFRRRLSEPAGTHHVPSAHFVALFLICKGNKTTQVVRTRERLWTELQCNNINGSPSSCTNSTKPPAHFNSFYLLLSW